MRRVSLICLYGVRKRQKTEAERGVSFLGVIPQWQTLQYPPRHHLKEAREFSPAFASPHGENTVIVIASYLKLPPDMSAYVLNLIKIFS